MSAKFLPFRQQIVDPQSGIATREFWLFLQNFFDTSGQGAVTDEMYAQVSPSFNQDAVVQAANDLGLVVNYLVQETGQAPTTAPLFMAVDDILPVFSRLEDQIAMLRAEISNLQQGNPVL